MNCEMQIMNIQEKKKKVYAQTMVEKTIDLLKSYHRFTQIIDLLKSHTEEFRDSRFINIDFLLFSPQFAGEQQTSPIQAVNSLLNTVNSLLNNTKT